MQSFFFIRTDNKYMKVSFHDILYVETCKNYIRLVTTSKTYIVLIAIKQIEQELPPQLFCRVHRSFIVGINVVCSFDNEVIYLCGSDKTLRTSIYQPGHHNQGLAFQE